MKKLMRNIKEHARIWVQIVFAAVSNGYLYGYMTGQIYRGPLKAACMPGLNCYSCPGALGSCPIGSLQAVLGSRNYRFFFLCAWFFDAVWFLVWTFDLRMAVSVWIGAGFAV